MESHAYAVILAGGSGERFWPLSTKSRPKQFVSVFGGKPLIRHAVDRLEGLVPPERVLIVTSADLAEASAEACPGVPRENVVGEPCRRDTAAACALAAGLVAARDPAGIAVIVTADQLMDDLDVFRRTLADSVRVASADDAIVTIGIAPTFPATGYGYIEAGDSLSFDGATKFFKARRFVEKPDEETARAYLATGRFCWNSGMFIWSAATMAGAVARHAPALLPLTRLPSECGSVEELGARLAEVYPSLPKISVDYAIMERHGNIVMARGEFGWDDVGSWPSISRHIEADGRGNTLIGLAAVEDASDSIVVSTDGVVAALGIEGMVVVRTGNATLVCPKSRAQELKKLVRRLGADDATAGFV